MKQRRETRCPHVAGHSDLVARKKMSGSALDHHQFRSHVDIHAGRTALDSPEGTEAP